jgi:hypothetical protein
MFVVIRLLPAFLGAFTALAFAYQARDAAHYPWIAVAALAAFGVGGFLIAWSRHRHVGDARPLIPGLIAIASAAFGLILAEGALAAWIIPVIAGGTALLVSELLFLSLYAPARYPVNGLSHVNLVLVPIALWFAAYASLGLTVFVDAARVIPIAVIGAVSLALFSATSHAEASPATRRRWTLIGGWIGIQTGILIAALPLDLIASSTFVALTLAYVLRTRRYGIPPAIPTRQIVAEALAFSVLLIVILATARWM